MADNLINLEEHRLMKAKDTAASFAAIKVPLALDELEKGLTNGSGHIVWDRSTVAKIVGKYMSLGYALGAIDQFQKKLIK